MKLFETITFLRETKMNPAILALRERSQFQASLVSFLGLSHRPGTATLAPFTPSSSREDRYVNANILETQLFSDAVLTFPSLIFYLSTGMNLGRQAPDPPGSLLLII
jgi:hypothetical protein